MGCVGTDHVAAIHVPEQHRRAVNANRRMCPWRGTDRGRVRARGVVTSIPRTSSGRRFRTGRRSRTHRDGGPIDVDVGIIGAMPMPSVSHSRCGGITSRSTHPHVDRPPVLDSRAIRHGLLRGPRAIRGVVLLAVASWLPSAARQEDPDDCESSCDRSLRDRGFGMLPEFGVGCSSRHPGSRQPRHFGSAARGSARDQSRWRATRTRRRRRTSPTR